MKRLISSVLLVAVSTVGLYGITKASDDLFSHTGTSFKIPQASMVSFSCGEGWINISLETGEATFVNCNPSEASKRIWEGLKPFFEGYKKSICEYPSP